MKILPKRIIKKFTRTVGDKNEIDEIMGRALIFHSIIGNQLLDPQWSWKKSLLHQIVIWTMLIYPTLGTLDVVTNTGDIKLIAEGAYTLGIIVLMPIKFYVFLNKRHYFQKVYIQLKGSLYNSIKDNSEKKLKDILKKVKILVDILLCMMGSSVATYVLIAMWYYMNGERRTLSRSTANLMPMTTPYCEIGLLLHGVLMFIAAYMIQLVDLWFVLIMFFFCTACDVTAHFLNVEKLQNESQREYAARLNHSLKKFYNSHIILIEFLETFNAMYKWLALMPLINVSYSICVILWLLSKEKDLMFATNLIPELLELFIYNWFGEKIKNKVANWKTALLKFDWLSLLPEHRKCYYILVVYMDSHVVLKTATGTDLSLLTMSNVLKFSYQTFTVLQNVEI